MEPAGCATPGTSPVQVACGVGFTAFLVKAGEANVAAMGVYEPPEEPQPESAAAKNKAAAAAAAGAKRKAAALAAGKAKKAK
jgi:hypothetical protein